MSRSYQLAPSLDLSTLNKPQREAVEHISGPTLVLAGAGSGKTRVLTHKIAHLVDQGISPWRILAVTFTNKAAREMTGRVEQLLGMPAQGLWIGTFHGICCRILRREADRWGFRRDFTIYDRDDQKTAVRKAIKALGLPKDRIKPPQAISIIGKAKNDALTPDQLEEQLSGPDAGYLAAIYRMYQRILDDAGAFDFDDLLVRPVEKFQAYPDTLASYQKRFSAILVDEYQDTNRVQYLLMRLLGGDSGRMTVVGDDDQSIYSWRGADIRNILEFERDYPKVHTVRLEQNYRSTGNILAAANAVVANNEGRMPKRLWTADAAGEKVRVLECRDDRDEASRVIDRIEDDRREHDTALRDMVILYRTNAQSRAFEEVLRRRNILYVIVGGLRFYERKEVKDILAHLRCMVNPNDVLSFTRAISNPKRGVGDRTIEKLEAFAVGKKISFRDALDRAGEVLTGGSLSKVVGYRDMLDKLSGLRETATPGEVAEALVEELDYEKWLGEQYPEDVKDRIENVRELIAALEEYEAPEDEDPYAAFLAEVSLMADVDTWDDDTDAITLMSLHAAKGLEFTAVHIGGVERGLFPLPSSYDAPEDLEEERRLFYVGITRARERLTISYAVSRMRHGIMGGGQSFFVDEMPDETIDFHGLPKIETPTRPYRGQPIRKPLAFEDYSQETPDAGEGAPFAVGSHVRHPIFGRGQITACRGVGGDATLTIKFGAKTKKIVARFANLTPA
jgi:DNA helicase II / ATP-dependent DNA helicase PcrA